MPTTVRPTRPRAFAALGAVILVSTVIAGCLGPDPGDGRAPPVEDGRSAIDIPSVDYGHDHTDAALHPSHAMGVRVLGSVVFEEGAFSRPVGAGPAQFELGTGGRLVLVGDLLFITTSRRSGDVAGAAETFQAGFAVFDVSDPRAPVRLGDYRSEYGSSEGEGLAVTSDAKYAFVLVETAHSVPPVPPAIEIVDVGDPADPRLTARIPWVGNPHVASMIDSGGAEYVAVSVYEPTYLAEYLTDAGELNRATNRLQLWRFDRGGAPWLTPGARYTFTPEKARELPFFPHDHSPIVHPATGDHLLYFGAFGGGGRILSLEGDLSQPRELEEVGYTLEKGDAPVIRHHSFQPAPVVVDGVLATAAVPRSKAEDGLGSAYLTVYDTLDPAHPTLIGQWRHPDTEFPPDPFPVLNLHVPVFTADGQRLLVPHYHAGLFVFDVSSRAAMEGLTPIAYWSPDGADAQEGAPVVTSVIQAIEVDGVILVTDRSAGRLYVLELDA